MPDSNTSARVGIRSSVGALALLLALMIVGVVFLLEHRAARAWRTEPVELSERVIPRSSEGAVASLVAQLDALEDVDEHSFSIESDVVLVQLFDADTRAAEPGACDGPDWVRPPAALALEHAQHESTDSQGETWTGQNLRVHLYACDSTPARLRSALRAKALEFDDDPALQEIWPARLGPRDPDWVVDDSGLLRPAARATGLDHEQLTILVFALGLAACVALGLGLGEVLPGPLGRSLRRPPEPRWTVPLLVSLFVACIGLRFMVASVAGVDSDESWAGRIDGSIFHESHDAWVHPPLFHMLQQPWVRFIGWTPATAIVWMRLPWLGFGLAATALVLAHALATRSATWQLGLVLPCLLVIDLAERLILARPYALATLLIVIVAFFAWAPFSDESPSGARLRWTLIPLAAGLAMWTDLVAGAIAAALIVVRLVSVPTPARARAAACLVLFVWGVALLPGAAWASRHQVDPGASRATIAAEGMLEPGHLAPGLEKLDHMPAIMVFGHDAPLWPLGLLAIAGLLALVGVAHARHERRVEAWIPLVLLAAAMLTSATLVNLRPRNIAFAPQLVAIFASIVLARRSADRV